MSASWREPHFSAGHPAPPVRPPRLPRPEHGSQQPPVLGAQQGAPAQAQSDPPESNDDQPQCRPPNHRTPRDVTVRD